ncbi:YihY/virulence factor BrkB family protein [Filimonas effusa]|uniref:YihY/virulence factor BrkB family protein n=1 Tax=Filimonas effusa TaxID=2508721 RepID=A0A4Q1D6M2_9BACT|nr:YihY/virulence factor BrkB family protein [Filimonas effusa]RXK83307.1 YihY/virulence factor BrkB family protein [Filimonas effusa]
MKIRDWGKMFWQAINDFLDNGVLRMSAALAYYTIFALAPMLIIIISIADLFWGRDAINGSVYYQLNDFLGAQAASQVQDMLKNAAISGSNTLATVIGIVSLVFAATGVFTEIQVSINTIWHLKTKPKKGQGILKFVLNRLISFSMVVGLGFILLVSLAVNTVMDTLLNQLTRIFPDNNVNLAYITNYVVTFGVISFLFAVIFKVLPDARVKWKDVWMGAFSTAILFMLGKFGISFYLSKSTVASTYGAAGSMVLLLLWVYYSSAILYFGAGFTRVYACFRGRNIYPNDYAVYIVQVEKENHESLAAQEVVAASEKAK